MKQIVDKIIHFIKYDLFSNLGYYLLQIFLCVLLLFVFVGINIVVRLVTDPLCIKVLRMKENKRGPGIVAFTISFILTALLLAITYQVLPQLRPTVIGWTGQKAIQVINWTRGVKTSDVEKKVEDVKDKLEGVKDAIKSELPEGDKGAVVPEKTDDTPSKDKEQPKANSPPAE